jgi:hypothetical protein
LVGGGGAGFVFVFVFVGVRDEEGTAVCCGEKGFWGRAAAFVGPVDLLDG